MATLTVFCKLCFGCLKPYSRFLIIFCACFLLQSHLLEGVITDFESAKKGPKKIECGSSCKRPKQGPPGPAFNSYVSRISFAPQILTSFDFKVIDFETPLISSSDWTYSGGTFTSTTSGIYMVSFKVMFDMENTFPGAHTLGVQLFNTLPISLIYPQSYSQVQNLSNPAPGIRPITLESTFMIDYVAGTPLSFAYFGANLTPFNSFNPSSTSGSASMSIFRIN